ncbi:alpha/beta hydrolase [Flaviaesturariibacter flavus]|uniref:Alpha/beta hydrolase n=1 Tax=Flaviaesturariibacter flavus TaxID=2502780 RepID=A0A4R1BJW0_9BACT|nr:alpha/beta hydrolase [Flaviaesturariibacter flavus]TCJ17695.1 alpha/beta hydrolase [Flaviaesturariibacter flavus]
MNRSRKTLIICAALLSACLCGQQLQAQEDSAGFRPVVTPGGYSSRLNVVYTKVGEWDGRMDLYLPPAGKPAPAIINIHGGGWNKGVKESQSGFNTFFKAGFAVANIEYRLTGQATAPAAVEDTRCALIYLVEHAKELNIDPERIVIMGGSAGGHLALMGGMLANDHRFDGNCATKKNIKVAAIVDKYGITDVWDWGYGKDKTSRSATAWLGTHAQDKGFAASVSPVSYISKNTPPIFIVHGDADPTVPYQHSVLLHQRLTEAGVKTKFITVPGGQHGKFDKDKNSEINQEIIAFLKEVGVI